MHRSKSVLRTEYNSVEYRSQTEARWAVFFDTLGVSYKYEPERIELSSGVSYLPDFYIHDFNAYFEVKPSDVEIVTEESIKARQLSHDRPGQRVWLSIGGPAPNTPNILPLDQWPLDVGIDDILSSQDNRYWFHEDRRDEHIYWLHSEMVHGYMIGGPGTSTDHLRGPLNHRPLLEPIKRPFLRFQNNCL